MLSRLLSVLQHGCSFPDAAAGYFQAPGTQYGPLRTVSCSMCLPHVTLIFCALDGYASMKARPPMMRKLGSSCCLCM